MATTGRKVTKQKKEIVEKIPCKKCGSEKSPNTQNFYANTHPLFSTLKLEVCKDCINEYIGEKGSRGYEDRIKLVLALMDKPWLPDLWESRDKEWSKYIPQLSSFPQYRGMTYADSIFDKEIDKKKSTSVTEYGEVAPDRDMKFYSSKWMGEYTKEDIEYLESYYIGLDRDFKIVTTNHKDYAKKISKASLHMDRCFQDMLAGVSGADKKYKDAKDVFDTLSKSAQFSESQRGQNDVSLGCFGVTFDQVEQNKWIPKHIPMEEDAIDKIIRQFATINESV